ncbi:MAG: CDP-alcohol phosphatidyltransferase family protein [Myxococcaceae bacterium]
MSSGWLTVPNALTLLRLAAIPVFLVLMLTERPQAALLCFVLAAATDGLDGFLARLLKQQTEVGALLDPLADKLLAFVALTVLSWQGNVALWLWWLLAIRETGLFVGAVWAKRRAPHHALPPTRVGKYAMLTLSLLVATALVERALVHAPRLHGYVQALTVIAAVAVAVSLVQYLARLPALLSVRGSDARPSSS